MDEYSLEEIFSFWQKGKTISEAIFNYCNKDILEEYSNFDIETSKIDANAIIQGAINSLRDLSEYNSGIKKIQIKLYQDISNKIISGKLLAIGYKAPINSDLPSIIPLHMWPPETIDEKTSSISANAINYLRVRIVKSPLKKKLKKTEEKEKKIAIPDIKIEDKQVGRPSKKEKIIKAYESLKKERKIDYSKTLKSHTELIQETVQELFPTIKDTVGMQHEAIRRAIGKHFNADKGTSKPTSKL